MSATGLTGLRELVDFRQQLQKTRIQMSNRLSAVERGVDTSHDNDALLLWREAFDDLESGVEADIERRLKDVEWPIFDAVVGLKGIGTISAAKVLADIDIARANTISALWRYAGYGVREGQRERLVKGEKAHFNRRLKIACRLIGESFLKSRSPYAEIYYSAKQHYAATHPDWTPAHAHNAALGKMIKLFLSHLWLVWRELEGLPTREPYASEHLRHENIMRPESFGWKWQPSVWSNPIS